MMSYYRAYDEDYPIGCESVSAVGYNLPEPGFVTIKTFWWKTVFAHTDFATITTIEVIYAPSICQDIIRLWGPCENESKEEHEAEMERVR